MADVEPKHVLITFGRSFLSLNLARQFAAAGHRVSVADSIPHTISHYSKAVGDFFAVPPPKFEPVAYCREIARICEAEKVDLLVPIHEETDILSMMTEIFPPGCEVFLSDFPLENTLHHKILFQQELERRGIPTLKFAEIAAPSDIEKLDFERPFAVKQAYSRGAQRVYKAHPGDSLDYLTFDPMNPWIAQDWLSGDRYCTYSVVRDGKVNAHTVYPVRYAIGGSSCLTFEPVTHRGIFDWVESFVAEIGFTGQIAFDFIEHPERGLYTIECNPRATSGAMMFDPADRLDLAFLGENDGIVEPGSEQMRMIGIGMVLFGWRPSSWPDDVGLRDFVRDFRRAKDVVYHPEDRKPGFMLPLAYADVTRQSLRHRVGLAEGFMHDHSWDGRRI